MLPDAKCDDSGCVPAYLQSRGLRSTTIPAQSLPFLLTFALAFTVVYRRLYPRLSGHSLLQENAEHNRLSAQAKWPSSSPRLAAWPPRITAQRLMALSFSATFSFACVVPELVLCEISNLLHPEARGLAVRVTMSGLLVLLLIVTPLLQLHSIIKGLGLGFRGSGRLSSRVGWVLEAIGFSMWITGFWWVGQGLPGAHPILSLRGADGRTVREACIARVAVIGVALMALLSGFASVSTPWQKFGVRSYPVTETDIARKQAGLEATDEMLTAKRSRLRALERKMMEMPPEGLLTKVMGAVRGNADSQECKSLQLEINGLQTMQASLNSSLSVLQRRRYAQKRMSTRFGRLLSLANYFFSIYCLYRIFAASVSVFRRWWSPNASYSTVDPITNLIALIAEHINPAIDQVSWARQISFVLSGVILLASFSSVIQTIHLFSRFAPTMLFLHAQANIALLISQISGTYVISSALLLRSSLPQEMGTVISEALGAPLEPSVVDRWFEGWFLTASLSTAMGILVAKKLAGPGDWEDDDLLMDRDPEVGTKRS
jgi:Abscisic acid G-protein coupled receptor/The Golgi pH Regulator (GPHR) Family N-terminal